jgi:hypothetical protein
MDLVINSLEHDWLLRPTQRLCRLGMKEVDLALVLAVAPSAHMRHQAPDDHVDGPLGLLEGAVGVARLWWRRQAAIVVVRLWLRLVMVRSSRRLSSSCLCLSSRAVAGVAM